MLFLSGYLACWKAELPCMEQDLQGGEEQKQQAGEVLPVSAAQ